ncbi:hypothetical protein GCM10009821_26450 [Aeromicrobium halocynthiae]|uniref:Apea-like HEPN domain-containing protein n=2 Tax=Aeromicrobium halocynthiae TaxID=560557 RepID=A0ABP5HPV0_9ACTN
MWNPQSGAELELIGGLQGPGCDNADAGLAGGEAAEFGEGTVYGEIDGGKRVTLWDAERRRYTTDLVGELREEYWCSSWVCVGAHISSADQQSLSNFRVVVDDLYYLTNDSRFAAPRWAKIEGVEDAGEHKPDGSFLAPYVLPVVGGVRADVATGATSSASYSVFTNVTRPWISEATEAMPDLKLDFMIRRTRAGPSITIGVDTWTRIEPTSSPASARDLLGEAQPLLALMRLSTYGVCGAASMSAVCDGNEVSLLSHLGSPSSPESPATANVIFTFADVSLESFMRTWERLGHTPQARYARDMTVGQIGHSPVMVEEHISQVLGSAEGFQRWCLGGGKGPSLNQRLLDLLDRLSVPIQTQIGLDERAEKWATWAVWARNNVDHGGAEKHRPVADFYHFKVIADSVRLVTYLVALTEFGVDNETIEEALRNHPRLSVIAKRCSQIADLPSV